MTATIPAAPPVSAHAHASTYSDRWRKIALLVVALAFVMDLMDATILNIALPTIQNTLHAGAAALQWMAAGYTLTFALLLIGKSQHPLTIDVAGTLMVALAIGLLVFPLIQGHEYGWPTWAFVMMAVSVPVFGVFAYWQRRKARVGDSPLVIPALFKHRSFSVGLTINLLVFATMACFALTFTLVLQLGHGFSAIRTVLTALFITIGILPTIGLLSKKVIPALGRWSLTLGAAVMALGTAAAGILVTSAGTDLSTWRLGPALLVIGCGMGLIFAPLMPFILSNVDPQDAGSASGTANAVQQVGGALGIGLIGVVFFGQLASRADYDQAFGRGVWLQLVLLVVCVVLSFFLPRRIAAEAYTQQR